MGTEQPYPMSLAMWVHSSTALQMAMVALGCLVCDRFATTYTLSSTGAVVLSAMLLTLSSQW